MSTAIAAQDNQPPPQPPGKGGGTDDTAPGEPASKPSNIVVEAFSSSGSVSNRSEETTDNVPALTEQNVAAKDRIEEEEDSRVVEDQWEGRRRPDTDHATDRATLGTANATNVTVRLPRVTRSNEGTPRGRAATQTGHPLTPAKAHIDYLPNSADLRALNALLTRSGTRFSTRSYPAQVMRMSTISLSRARSQPTRMGINNYFEEQNINKTMSWDKAMESRPPSRWTWINPAPPATGRGTNLCMRPTHLASPLAENLHPETEVAEQPGPHPGCSQILDSPRKPTLKRRGQLLCIIRTNMRS
ncbi:Hypp4687 [Branchiostoma lanceolatum]|uniref:Hypp4687 protein n=1 Tax=Branchiostoma lanceolatum TaxID=7740 RepID=A0A8K0A940_BRALA|nr:Hypp4687 [Branchiostoma lanceolatum]